MEELLLPRSYLRRLACGDNYTMLVLEDGELMATGENQYGQLGLEGQKRHGFTPVPFYRPALTVSCDTSHTALLCQDGKVHVSGLNALGQLGQKTEHQESVFSFTRLVTRRAVASVLASYASTFVLYEDGSLAACGTDNFGKFGRRGKQEYLRKLVKLKVREPVAQVASGMGHTLLLYDSGRVAGAGIARNLGLAATSRELTSFTRIPLATRAVEVACGDENVAILLEERVGDGRRCER